MYLLILLTAAYYSTLYLIILLLLGTPWDWSQIFTDNTAVGVLAYASLAHVPGFL